jgi:threonyl-tRNA synthetase
MAEFGCCHRNEASGALHGLMRVREFVQDDAHIFCTEDQVVDETGRFVRLLLEVYKDLGFDEVTVKLSDRPDKRAGTDATWNKAEASLEQAIKATGLHYTINKGEGAFYGPKLEFLLRDAIGRDWQCGTLQVDFVLPERLAAEYVDNTGTRVAPVILHRAILGTLERFIGILIENCEGKFPLWLAPVQVVILPITDEVLDYATQLCDHLKAHDVRAILDASHEKIEYKIRKHSLLKVALLAIVGHREKENRTVTIRTLGKQEQVNYTEPEFYDHIIQLTRLT